VLLQRSSIAVEALESAEMEFFREILKVISKKGVSDILFCLSKEQKRFSQIMFETRLNSGVLGRHLKELRSLGIVTKNGEYYTLSEIGMNAIGILNELKKLAKLMQE